MKIKDFIDGRNVSYQTVRKYIVNHPEVFKGHIGRTNNIVLDDVAIEILEKKYPFPEPVQVIQDTEAREKLHVLTEKYAASLEKINVLTEQNAKLLVIQSRQTALEEENYNYREALAKLKREQEGWIKTFKDREKEVVELELRLKKERGEAELMEEMLGNKITELENKLEQEKKKTWWDKLRGR